MTSQGSIYSISTLIISLIILTGCGGGSSSDKKSITNPQERNSSIVIDKNETVVQSKIKAYLIDSPLSGVNYSCDGNNKGLTDNNGMFECQNPPIVFKVGNLTIGMLNSYSADSNISLQEILGLSKDNFSDSTLKLLARFLQSLDDDGDIKNRITITKDIRKKITKVQNFKSMSESEVKALLQGLGKEFVPECGALKHLGDMSVNCNSDGSYVVISPPEDSTSTSNNSKVLKGKFVDSKVKGLEYYTKTQSGVTNKDGEYNYIEGEEITFHTGGIIYGRTKAKPITTPIDLVKESNSTQNPKVVKISQFLQSLDKDGSPDNGIEIIKDAKNKFTDRSLDFSLNREEFHKKATGLLKTLSKPVSLVLADKALSHLSGTINDFMESNQYCAKEDIYHEFYGNSTNSCKLINLRDIYYKSIRNLIYQEKFFLGDKNSEEIDNSYDVKKDIINSISSIYSIYGTVTADTKEEFYIGIGKQKVIKDFTEVIVRRNSIDKDIAETWVKLFVAYLESAVTGKSTAVISEVIETSSKAIIDFRTALILKGTVQEINELTIVDDVIRYMLSENIDIENISALEIEKIANTIIKTKRKNLFTHGYNLVRIRDNIFNYLNFLIEKSYNINLTMVKEGNDIVIQNNSSIPLYNMKIINSKQKTLLKQIYDANQSQIITFKDMIDEYNSYGGYGLKLEYTLRPQKNANKHTFILANEVFVDLTPPTSSNFYGIVPNKDDIEKLKQIHEKNIDTSTASIGYFMEDIDKSINHDNDPFRVSESEEVHNLVEYPSHFLYSLEDYKWDKTSKRLIKRIDSFFSNKKTSARDNDNRIPLLIIHGWQGSPDEDTPREWFENADSGEEYFENFIKYISSEEHGKFFSKHYKPYIYHYPSFKHITYNGRRLSELIAKTPTLANYIKNGGKIAIVAHSMGGLVSRSLIEEYGITIDGKSFKGEQFLDRLITLATPHHGSPAGMRDWVDTSKIMEKVGQKSLYTQGAEDLMWDNYDDRLSDNEIQKDILHDGISSIDNQIKFTYNQKDSNFYKFYLDKIKAKSKYYYLTYGNIPKYPNPWLTLLNKNRDRFKGKYFYYGSYPEKDKVLLSGDCMPLINNVDFIDLVNNTLGFCLAGQYVNENSYLYNDSVVAIQSAFNYEYGKIFTPQGVDLYRKDENYRFIRDLDHDLFRAGIHNKFRTHTPSNKIKMLKQLLKVEILPNWAKTTIISKVESDPLWLMVKQDLGYGGAIEKPTITAEEYYTNKDSVKITINGEPSTQAIINGTKVGELSSSGELVVNLDTSGEDGDKEFSLILKNAIGLTSIPYEFAIYKDATAPEVPIGKDIPTTTYDNKIEIKIQGEVNSEVIINGESYGKIPESGELVIELDIDTIGDNNFKVILVDRVGNSSDILEFSIKKENNIKLILNVTANDGNATFSWRVDENVSSYYIYLAQESGVTKDNIHTIKGGKTYRVTDDKSPFDIKLVNDITYYAILVAYKDGQYYTSDEVSFSPTKKGKLFNISRGLNAYNPIFTKNGKYILFEQYEDGGAYRTNIYAYIFNTENNSLKRFNEVMGTRGYYGDFSLFLLSEDGKRIFYEKGNGSSSKLYQYIIDINKTEIISDGIGGSSTIQKFNNSLLIDLITSNSFPSGSHNESAKIFNLDTKDNRIFSLHNYYTYNYFKPKIINNQFLYYSNPKNIYKIDTTVTDYESTKETIEVPIDSFINVEYSPTRSNGHSVGYEMDNQANIYVSVIYTDYNPKTYASKQQVVLFNKNENIVEFLSMDSSGNFGDKDSNSPKVSGNGKWVVFVSRANNITKTDTQKCILYNVETKKSIVLDKDSKESCYNPLISDDGSKIVMKIGGYIYLYKQ